MLPGVGGASGGGDSLSLSSGGVGGSGVEMCS